MMIQNFIQPISSIESGAANSSSDRHENEGYCMVFLRKTKYHLLSIEKTSRLVWRRNEEDSKTDHANAPNIGNPSDMLEGLRTAGISYCLQYSNDPMKKYIYAVISVNNELAEIWADRHDLVIPVHPVRCVTAGRSYEHFYLAHRTFLADDQESEYFDTDTNDKYEKLPLALWQNIHLPFETTINREIYVNYPPYNSVLDNRLYLRVLYDILIADRKFKGASFNIDRLLHGSDSPLYGFFALNMESQPYVNDKDWYTPQLRTFWIPKIEEIRDYYGELIAFYLYFLSHYSKWLIPLAIYGLIWFIVQLANNNIAIPGSEAFILISLLWSTLMIEHWYRHENWLQFKWGMMQFYQSEVPRPQFKGKLVISRSSGELIETYESYTMQYLKIIFSMSTVLVCVAGAISAVVSIWILKRDLGTKSTYSSIGLGCLNSVQIQIMNKLYIMLAYYLNEWEGHRLQEEWYNHLVIKRIFFFIVNSFNSLFYLAYVADYSSYSNPNETCLKAVRTQLITLFLASIFVTNALNIGLPKLISYIQEKLFERQEEKFEQKYEEQNEKPLSLLTTQLENNIDQVEDNNNIPIQAKHNVINSFQEHHGGIQSNYIQNEPTDNNYINDDYKINKFKPLKLTDTMLKDIEYQMTLQPSDDVLDNTAAIVVQYGYIMLFAMVFPLMPLLGIINNFVEIRVDLYNLLNEQRPIPLAADGIGVWKPVLSCFSVVAVFTNLSLFTFKTDLVHHYVGTNAEHKIIFFFVVSFVILMLMFILRYSMDDVTWKTQEAIERQELCEKHLLTGEVKAIAKTINATIYDQSTTHLPPMTSKHVTDFLNRVKNHPNHVNALVNNNKNNPSSNKFNNQDNQDDD